MPCSKGHVIWAQSSEPLLPHLCLCADFRSYCAWISAQIFVLTDESLRRFSFLLMNLCADFRSYWWISAQIFVLTVFTGSEMFTDCRVCIVSLTYAWLELDQKHSTWTRQLNALYARPSEARLLKILVIEQLKLRQGKIQQLPKLEVLSKSLHWI